MLQEVGSGELYAFKLQDEGIGDVSREVALANLVYPGSAREPINLGGGKVAFVMKLLEGD